jgi:hypothetical protein
MPVNTINPAPNPLNINGSGDSIARRENANLTTKLDQNTPERNAGSPGTQNTLQTTRANEATSAPRQEAFQSGRSQNSSNSTGTAGQGGTTAQAQTSTNTSFLADIALSNRVNLAAGQSQTRQASPTPTSPNQTAVAESQSTNAAPGVNSTATQSPESPQTQIDNINATQIRNALQAPRLGAGINLNI